MLKGLSVSSQNNYLYDIINIYTIADYDDIVKLFFLGEAYAARPRAPVSRRREFLQADGRATRSQPSES